DANGMPAKTGVYFYRLEAENFKQTRKMTLIK
ncbi:peptidase S8, partial [candidate division KSB1 bacterium]